MAGMEQVKVTTKKDDERMYKILSDLMNTDKEFQIMITVPGNSALTVNRNESDQEEETGMLLSDKNWREAKNSIIPQMTHDLEKDVTETTNVASEHPEIVRQLYQLMDEARVQSDHPNFNF